VVLYPGGQGNRVGWEVLGSNPPTARFAIYFATMPRGQVHWTRPSGLPWTRPSGRLWDPPVRSVVSGPLDPPVRSVVGSASQICRGTRLLGRTWLMGPVCQASVGTCLWDPGVRPARQVGCGIRPSDLLWDPPTRSDLADGTRSLGQCWVPPVGPIVRVD
jgi:hypothetical protein